MHARVRSDPSPNLRDSEAVIVVVGVGREWDPLVAMCSWLCMGVSWYLHMSGCGTNCRKGWDGRLFGLCWQRGTGTVRGVFVSVTEWGLTRHRHVLQKGVQRSIILCQSDPVHLGTIAFPRPPHLPPPHHPLPPPTGPGLWKRHQTQSCLLCPRPAGASASGRHFPPQNPRPAC